MWPLFLPHRNSLAISLMTSKMAFPTTSSLRLFTTKLPLSLHPNTSPTKTPTFPFSLLYKPITFQTLTPTKSSPSPPPQPSSPSPVLQSTSELPPKLQEIISLFQSVPDPKSKYQQLLFYGKTLKPLDSEFKTRENKVEGCVSQVWVRAYLDNDSNVVFEADSDSVLTKGLAALLVQGLSGRPVDEVLRISPDFITLLGLQQSLTPSRNNGFLNMLRLMQKKALLLLAESGKERNSGSGMDTGGVESSVGNNLNGSNPFSGVKVAGNDVGSGSGSRSKQNGGTNMNGVSSGSGLASNLEVERSGKEKDVDAGSGLGNRGNRIKERLESELSPAELVVEDVSYQHSGHAGVRGSDDGETHFNLRIVSKEFEGKSLVKRHRLVYDLLQEELQTGLHALSIVAKTPSEV